MATIKNIILLVLTLLVMVGCDVRQPDRIYKPVSYRTYIIDSCEYVGYADNFVHKGNCRFCKERRQKELEELVIKLKEIIKEGDRSYDYYYKDTTSFDVGDTLVLSIKKIDK